jgi:hypothetical protein
VKDLKKLRVLMVAISFFYAVFAFFCILGGLILFLIYREFFIDGIGPGDSVVYIPILLIAAMVLIDILLIIGALALSWHMRRRASIPRRMLIRYLFVPTLIVISAVIFSVFTQQRIGFTQGYMYPVPIALCILLGLSWMLVHIPGSLLTNTLPVRRVLRINAMLPVGFALLFSLTGLLYTFDDGPYQLIFATFEYLTVVSAVVVTMYCIIRFSLSIEYKIEGGIDQADKLFQKILKRTKEE